MRILQMIGVMLLVTASPAAAATWTVTQKSGDVRVLRNGMQPASLQVRSTVAPGDVVATGATARALLTNGDDYVIVAPGSRLLVPKEQQQSGFTRLVQQVGTMLYKVKHTGIPHFAVQTPMLAAVVKGTSFTIVVDQERAAVQVTDGVVEVNSADGYARRLVERCLTVYVGRERPSEIIELKSGVELPKSQSTNEQPVKIERSGDVPLSTVANLTGGLVREVPTAAPIVVRPAETVAAVQPAASGSAAPAATPVATSTTGSTPAVGTPAVGASPQVVPAVTVDVSNVVAPVTAVVPVQTVSVATPAVSTPAVTVPALSTPVVNTPAVTVTPAVIATPAVSTPAVTTPVVTLPVMTVPANVPAVTVPPAIVKLPTPAVTPPVVTVPSVTPPTVTPPIVVALPVTPPVTIPAVTTPPVTTPVVSLPGGNAITPPVTIPSLGLGRNGG